MLTFPPLFPKNGQRYLTALVRFCTFVCGVGGPGAGPSEATGGHSGRNAKARGGGGGGGCSVVLMD